MADGIGCKCASRSEGDCCCDDVDWTPQETIDLRSRIASLEAKVKVAEEAVLYYEAALKAACQDGARGKVFDHWNAARIEFAKLREPT